MPQSGIMSESVKENIDKERMPQSDFFHSFLFLTIEYILVFNCMWQYRRFACDMQWV